MANIIINEKKNTIEITAAFNKKASVFGSNEYNALKEAKLDNPDFSVIVKAPIKRKNSFRGLSFEKMESYIKSHETEEEQIEDLKYLYKNWKGHEGYSEIYHDFYGNVKAWFINKFFPEAKKEADEASAANDAKVA